MLRKNLKSLALAGTVGMALILSSIAPAMAEDKADSFIPGEASATLTLTSDYPYRGISQTGEGPAIQGSFDYSYELFSAGVWASNIDFASSIELDWYAALGSEYNGVGWSVGFVYYSYPGKPHNVGKNFWEGNASLSYDFGFVAVSAGISISPDFQFNTGMAYYPNGSVTIPLGSTGFALEGTVGHQYIENNTVWGTPDYTDWSVGITYSVWGFDLAVRYHDTDLSMAECFGGVDACDERFLFSASRTF
jgi:uncharacterized protein (TIGR02001 family)